MHLRQIYPEDYPNNKMVSFTYTSNYYYDVDIQKKENDEGWSFHLQKTPFNKPFTKYLQEKVFETYKENTEYYLVLDDAGDEIGLLVFGYTRWNNLLRLWDLYIDKESQRKGLGTKLLRFTEKRAKELKVRGIVLECQSSNYPAIQFYSGHGFNLIGFDLISYTNIDVEKHEVRLEMAKLLDNVK
ncbi:MAG: GNAT family N-acetyltransferase [Candidatus Hodarchaeales archaeon]|jgi:ribosomal protein S18 acetylase RimI-like enzyme